MSWMERVLGTDNSNAVASFNAFTDSHVHVLHKMLRDSRTAAARLARQLGQSSYACTRREHLAVAQTRVIIRRLATGTRLSLLDLPSIR